MSVKTLYDVCVEDGIQTGPFGSQLHQSDYSVTGTPVIMPKDITLRGITEDGIARVEERHVQRLARHKVKLNDIVYPRRGDVGKSALITEKELGWLCGTGCLKVTIDDAIADAKYVHYYLSQNDVVSWLEKHSVGTTMMNINASILGAIPIDLPPLATQRRIAAILSDYDAAIANCRRQIALLEEAAQRLYREWFAEGKGEKWSTKTIDDLCVDIGSGGTPKRNKPEYWENGDVPWVKTAELQDCWLFDTDEKISKLGLSESAAKLFPAETIMMAIYASPTLGRLGIMGKPMSCNQATLCLIADDKQISWQWLYCRLYELRDHFNAIARGAGQQNISGIVVKSQKVAVPPKELIDKFTDHVKPMFEQQKELSRQIRALAEARDRLLPKLMSGEVAV